MQAKDGDLRRAAKADLQSGRTEAAAGVQMHVPNPVMTAGIFFCQVWQKWGADQRQILLAAVGMPGKLQIETPAGGSLVGKIRFVRQQDRCTFGGQAL